MRNCFRACKPSGVLIFERQRDRARCARSGLKGPDRRRLGCHGEQRGVDARGFFGVLELQRKRLWLICRHVVRDEIDRSCRPGSRYPASSQADNVAPRFENTARTSPFSTVIVRAAVSA